MTQPPDDGGAPRKQVKRLGGWLAMQVLGIVLRHYLTIWWNGNGPTW